MDTHRPVLSTSWAPEIPEWTECVDVIDRRQHSWWRMVLLTVWRSRRYRALVVVGSIGRNGWYQDLVIALLVRRLGSRRTAVVVTDCTWSPGSRRLAGGRSGLQRLTVLAHHLLVRLLDGPRTTFCVLSEVERDRFPRLWGVSREHVAVTPFHHSLHEHDGGIPPRGEHVFAGGDSYRDYDALLRAVEGTPDQVVIASHHRPSAPVPPNVSLGAVSHHEFLSSMARARVVVVPLEDDGSRSAGQQTYLNAMLLARPTIISDAAGVREMVTDGVDALVVPLGEPLALRAALERCRTASDEELDAFGLRARQTVLDRFTPRHYRLRLLELAGVRPG